jgi:hypothetical protein
MNSGYLPALKVQLCCVLDDLFNGTSKRILKVKIIELEKEWE